MHKGDDKENFAHGPPAPAKSSPPLNTNKELPSPPNGERRVVSDPNKRKGSTDWQDGDHPGIAELPANSVRHSRQQSQPLPPSGEWGSYAHYYDKLQSSVPGTRSSLDTEDQTVLPSRNITRSDKQAETKPGSKTEVRKTKDATRSEAKTKTNASSKNKESSSGRPAQMSRTQKEKDRKKRNKAKIITEHVDLIKDDFWEKRPWILSGQTG